MKKVIAIIIVLTMALSLAACGNSSATTAPDSHKNEQETESQYTEQKFDNKENEAPENNNGKTKNDLPVVGKKTIIINGVEKEILPSAQWFYDAIEENYKNTFGEETNAKYFPRLDHLQTSNQHGITTYTFWIPYFKKLGPCTVNPMDYDRGDMYNIFINFDEWLEDVGVDIDTISIVTGYASEGFTYINTSQVEEDYWYSGICFGEYESDDYLMFWSQSGNIDYRKGDEMMSISGSWAPADGPDCYMFINDIEVNRCPLLLFYYYEPIIRAYMNGESVSDFLTDYGIIVSN